MKKNRLTFLEIILLSSILIIMFLTSLTVSFYICKLILE